MFEHGDLDVETASRRGNFEADPAGTDHDELLVGGQGAQQRGGLIDCSHVVNALASDPGMSRRRDREPVAKASLS